MVLPRPGCLHAKLLPKPEIQGQQTTSNSKHPSCHQLGKQSPLGLSHSVPGNSDQKHTITVTLTIAVIVALGPSKHQVGSSLCSWGTAELGTVLDWKRVFLLSSDCWSRACVASHVVLCSLNSAPAETALLK